MPSLVPVSPTLLSVAVSWTRLPNFDAFAVFPNNGSMIRRLAFLHWLQRGEVRQLQRSYQDAMTSCCSSRRTSFPSLGDTSVSLVVFVPRRTSGPPRPGVGHPVSPAGIAEEATGSPKFLGNLNDPFAVFQTDAGRTAGTRPFTVPQRGPWSSYGRGSHDWVFRRSIARLSDSLSTLRSAGYPTPRKTRFQLLVRLSWAGFSPARFR